MRDWNFDLSDDLTEIAARVLPVEKIIMGRQPVSMYIRYDHCKTNLAKEVILINILDVT